MGCYRSYQTIKIGGFFNFAIKFLVAIFFAIVLFGCDGRECRNQYNDKAEEIIFEGIRDLNHLGGSWSCGKITDRYESIVNIYGARDDDIKLLLNNFSKVTDMPNVKITINVYKGIRLANKNLPPNDEPILILKLNTQSSQAE